MFQSSIDSKCSQIGEIQCDDLERSCSATYVLRVAREQSNIETATCSDFTFHSLFSPQHLQWGWIWLLWKENVAIRISFHLSLEVEGFNLYNLQTYCGSFTPLVKPIPNLGYRKGKWIGYNMSWRGYILTQILKLCWTDFSKGGVGLGSDPYNFLAVAFPHFF